MSHKRPILKDPHALFFYKAKFLFEETEYVPLTQEQFSDLQGYGSMEIDQSLTCDQYNTLRKARHIKQLELTRDCIYTFKKVAVSRDTLNKICDEVEKFEDFIEWVV